MDILEVDVVGAHPQSELDQQAGGENAASHTNQVAEIKLQLADLTVEELSWKDPVLHLVEVEEAERKRLSQELHDQVGPLLTTLSINLNLMRSQAELLKQSSITARLDETQAQVRELADCLRGVMSDLLPPMLDEAGLWAALNWYARRFTQRCNLDLLMDGGEFSPRLAPAQEMGFFRIAQEALNNIARHACAEQVVLRLSEDAGMCKMVVADDGIGLKSSWRELKKNGHWGLDNMLTRAKAIGANLSVESAADCGTSIILELWRR